MEPQVTISCNRTNYNRCWYKWLVLAILSVLLMTTIGIIIGAALSETFLNALPAVIVLAIILFILVSIQIIILMSYNTRTKR